MSLARWLEKRGPSTPREDAPHDGTELEESGVKPKGLSRWADESGDPHVASALGKLRELSPAPHHSGNVLHPFPVEAEPAYKSVPAEEMHALKAAAPVRSVSLEGLHSNGQRSVKPEHVASYIRRERPDDEPSREKAGERGPPIVVRVGGKDIIFDGHHRATAALLRGQTHIDARYVDLDAKKEP